MLLDARQVRSGTLLDTDVCIIGAGAAGIALAREFVGRSLDVVLLESGGVRAEAETQALYRGRVFGRPYFRLDEARTRRFGGSTHCWQGLCCPLEPGAFEERPWVVGSGWPFGADALQPYYERAQRVCRLGELDYRAERWAGPDAPPLALDPSQLESAVFQISPLRFASHYGEELRRASNVKVYLHANLVEFEARAPARTVARAHVATLSGRRFEVRARRYVLATGGIENARLLLASRGAHPAGLGNARDLVGRYFMEHPHVVSGAWLPSSASLPLGFYRPREAGGVRVTGRICPTARLQREAGILAFSSFLSSEVELPEFEEPLSRFIAEMDRTPDPARRAIFLMNALEQAPNPHSRVKLTDELDALGVPRVQLEWRLSPIDKRTLWKGQEVLARELGRQGLGRLQVLVEPDDYTWPAELGGGRHHMGTTRMHVDPRHGVVDADCRVHDVENLYIAGSSVFPTSGAANPTLTLVALALRLADHLREQLR